MSTVIIINTHILTGADNKTQKIFKFNTDSWIKKDRKSAVFFSLVLTNNLISPLQADN